MHRASAGTDGENWDAELAGEAFGLALANGASALAASAFLVALALWTVWSPAQRGALEVWGASMLGVHLGRAWLHRRALASQRAGVPLRRTAGLYAACALLGGGMWGIGAWVCMPDGNPLIQLFWTTLIGGIAFGGLAALYPHLPSAALFVTGALLPLGAREFAIGDRVHAVIGVTAVLFSGLLVGWGRELNASLRKSLLLRRRNQRLVAQLADSNQALEAQRNRAEAATEAKSLFLATMSHELRTPMHGILSMAEMLERAEIGTEHRTMVSVIRSSSSSLLRVINDLLDFSKGEAGKHDFEHRPFSLVEAIAEVRDLMRLRAEEKALALIVDLDPALPDPVLGDATRLKQILLNLVGNALKFTERGQVILRVALEVPGDGTTIRFEVIDTGIGLTEAQCAMLFQPFQQADSSTSRRFGGTGLGLSICRQYVEGMKGAIGVVSKIGRGSTFWMTLPLPAAPPPAEKGAAGSPILVVEDNEANRIIITQILSHLGYPHEITGSARDALALIEGGGYGLLLTDFRMPDMDGVELTAAIRTLEQQKGLPRLPVIALTADALDRTRERCLAAGMDGYLTKPIELRALLAVLEHWVPNTAAY